MGKGARSYRYVDGEGNLVFGQSNLAAIEDGDVILYRLSNTPLV